MAGKGCWPKISIFGLQMPKISKYAKFRPKYLWVTHTGDAYLVFLKFTKNMHREYAYSVLS